MSTSPQAFNAASVRPYVPLLAFKMTRGKFGGWSEVAFLPGGVVLEGWCRYNLGAGGA